MFFQIQKLEPCSEKTILLSDPFENVSFEKILTLVILGFRDLYIYYEIGTN